MGYNNFEELDKFTQFGEKIPNTYVDEEGIENVEYINPEDQLRHIFYIMKKATQHEDNKSIEQVRGECEDVLSEQIIEKQVNGVGGTDHSKLGNQYKEIYEDYTDNVVLTKLDKQKDFNSFMVTKFDKEKIPGDVDDFKFGLAKYGLNVGDKIDDKKDVMERIREEDPALYYIIKLCIGSNDKIDEQQFTQARNILDKFIEFGERAKSKIILESFKNRNKFDELCTKVAISAHKTGFNGSTKTGADYMTDVKMEIKKRNDSTLTVDNKLIDIGKTLQNTTFTGAQATRMITDLLNRYKNASLEERKKIDNLILEIIARQSRNPAQVKKITEVVEMGKAYVLSTGKEITPKKLVSFLDVVRNVDYEKEIKDDKQLNKLNKEFNKLEEKKNKSNCPENIKEEIENNRKIEFKSLVNATLKRFSKNGSKELMEMGMECAILMYDKFKKKNEKEPTIDESIKILTTAFNLNMDENTTLSQYGKRKSVKEAVNDTLNSVREYNNAVIGQNNINGEVAKISAVNKNNELRDGAEEVLLDEKLKKRLEKVREEEEKLRSAEMTYDNIEKLHKLELEKKIILRKGEENKKNIENKLEERKYKVSDLIVKCQEINKQKINVKRRKGKRIKNVNSYLEEKEKNGNISEYEQLLYKAKGDIEEQKKSTVNALSGF